MTTMTKEMCDIAKGRGRTGLILFILGLLMLAFIGIVFMLAFFALIPLAIILFIALYESGVLFVILIVGVGMFASGVTLKIIEHNDCADLK